MTKKMSNVSIKISAVIIAIFLWAFVMSDVNPEVSRNIRNVPVSYTNVSDLERQGLVIMEPQEISIDVRITGKKSDIDNFDENNIVAQVDLSGYSEGQVRIIPTVGIIGRETSVEISDYQPREILFTFDRMIQREYPVRVITTGELAENYLLDHIDTSTSNIIVSGPRTWMNEVDEVVVYVDLEGRTSTSTNNLAVTVVDDEGNEVRGVEKSPNMINLEIPILRAQTVAIELQTTGELPENFTVENLQVNPAKVKVKGDHRVMTLNKINTEEININTLLEHSSLEVDLILPEGVELLNPDEKITISYDITEEVTQSYSFSLDEVIANIGEGLSMEEESLDQTIEVNLSGTRDLIEGIGKEDISVSVDLEGLDAGSHEIEVRVEDIEGIVIEAEPILVTIILVGQETEE